jgi:hypothetical protein
VIPQGLLDDALYDNDIGPNDVATLNGEATQRYRVRLASGEFRAPVGPNTSLENRGSFEHGPIAHNGQVAQ